MYILNIIQVDDVDIKDEIVDTHFTCNLEKCKGACCTLESELGAPITADEIKEIREILPVVKEYLPEEHVVKIEDEGFYDTKNGEFLTKSLNNKACVFVYYDNGIAKCSIEKSYFEGKSGFRKPISCHLFPIRVSEFGGDVLRFEKFSECKPALEEGKKLGVSVAEFCEDSLVRKYGKEWYSKFREMVNK